MSIIEKLTLLIFDDFADVVGHFFMQSNNPNDWHYVDITHVSGDDYKWTNRAGRSWSLTKTATSLMEEQLDVGSDCPYFSTHKVLKFMNNWEYMLGPSNQKYYRRMFISLDIFLFIPSTFTS